MNKIAAENLTTGTLSPFLPGTKIQYAWDSISLGLLKTCPRLYQYTMIDGWQAKDENVHLRFGQEYHSALEDYDRYKAGGSSHDDAMHQAIWNLLIRTAEYEPKCVNGHDRCGIPDDDCPYCEKKFVGVWETDPLTKAGKYKNRKSLLALVIDYLDKFAEDPAETFILEDGKPGVELSFRFELDWGPRAQLQETPAVQKDILKKEFNIEDKITPQPYLLSGHLDRVVSFQDSLFVMDRKTATSTLSDYYFVQFEPSNQMTLYSLAAKVVMNAPVKGVIIDAAQIKLEDNHSYARRFTYRTEGQLEEWVHSLKFWLAQAETYAEANYWPMNDTACSMYGGCKFRDICSKDPDVRENFLKSKFNQLPVEERWNPLKAR